MKTTVKKLADKALGLIFPNRCPYCDSVIFHNEYACASCRPKLWGASIKRHAVGGYVCVSPFPYRGAYANAVKRFKFSGRVCYAKPLAFMLVAALMEQHETDFDFVTFVPMHKNATADRGYNQSLLLAKQCARLMNVPYEAALEKFRENKPQHRVHKSERETNVRGFYRALDKILIKNRKILIIDDIITTGNTLGECAKILMKNGADSVVCAAVCTSEIF